MLSLFVIIVLYNFQQLNVQLQEHLIMFLFIFFNVDYILFVA